MNTYIAYVPLKTKDGQDAAVAAPALTVGTAIRDVCSQLNATIAASGGYQANDEGEMLLIVAVFEVPEGIKTARHEVKDEMFMVYGVRDDETEITLRLIYQAAVDPIKSVIPGRIVR